jgi:uncharacterized protein (DUF2141 family)
MADKTKYKYGSAAIIKSAGLMSAAVLMLSGMSFTEPTGSVTVEVTNLKNNKGSILISLYNTAESFPENGKNAVAKTTAPIVGQKAMVTFKNLPYGKYAAAFLHDENNNLKMDFNIVGMPKEGFGFSNNPKVTLSTPSFEKAAFKLDTPLKNISVQTIYF